MFLVHLESTLFWFWCFGKTVLFVHVHCSTYVYIVYSCFKAKHSGMAWLLAILELHFNGHGQCTAMCSRSLWSTLHAINARRARARRAVAVCDTAVSSPCRSCSSSRGLGPSGRVGLLSSPLLSSLSLSSPQSSVDRPKHQGPRPGLAPNPKL